jgi:hypothetical protein
MDAEDGRAFVSGVSALHYSLAAIKGFALKLLSER